MIWFGRLRLHQRAGVDEDALAVRDEGVERAVVDDDHLDVLLRQPGGLQQRLGIFAQQLLDLGVANERQPALRMRRRHARKGNRRRRARPRRSLRLVSGVPP